MVMTRLTTEGVWDVLGNIPDPEIPAVSIVDLGIVENVAIEGDRVYVKCLPTFVGCPALDVIREDIVSALREIGTEPTVEYAFDPPWTTDRITDQGRRKLEEYGLAPPNGKSTEGPLHLTLLAPSACPFCGSRDTILESPFGPTLCRATAYCRACRNPFEQFKQL